MSLSEPSSIDTAEYRLSVLQGLDAMIKFLEAYRQYNGPCPDIDGLLTMLYYSTVDSQGEPNTGEPNVWSDWLEAIEQALAEPRLADEGG